MFLTVNQKLPIRKTIARALSGLDSQQIETCLVEQLQHLIKNIETTDNQKIRNDLCSGILSCAENYAPGLRAVTSVAGEIFQFTVSFLNQLVLCMM